MIGSLGRMVFVASAETLRTFSGLSRSGSARWHRHEMLGRKAKLEFQGPDLEQITFSVRLDAGRGLNPERELLALREVRDNGLHVPLTIGGQFLGNWVVQDLAEDHAYHDGKGRLLVATVSITLVEYVE